MPCNSHGLPTSLSMYNNCGLKRTPHVVEQNGLTPSCPLLSLKFTWLGNNVRKIEVETLENQYCAVILGYLKTAGPTMQCHKVFVFDPVWVVSDHVFLHVSR